MAGPVKIAIQPDDFDLNAEIAALRNAIGSADIGAIVTFTGICRGERDRLSALELDHYPGMAEAEIRRIADDAMARWPVDGITAIHRHGKIAPGGNIVLVIVAARHRQAAFDAAAFLMDFLKTRAPFWKKEHFQDGAQGGWVDAREADDDAAARWTP